MALIRDCQPSSFDEWQSWYFENAHTAGKNPTKITVESLHELGERLYAKITEVVILFIGLPVFYMLGFGL